MEKFESKSLDWIDRHLDDGMEKKIGLTLISCGGLSNRLLTVCVCHDLQQLIGNGLTVVLNV